MFYQNNFIVYSYKGQSEMLKYVAYLLCAIADIYFWWVLGDDNFATRRKHIYPLISVINDPFYLCCVFFSFVSFRKANYGPALFIVALPVVLTILYYLIFR